MIRNPFTTLRAQLVVLIVAALAVAQAISLWLFVDERSLAIRAALGFEAAGRAANVVRLIEQAPTELQPSILRAADSPLVRFSLDDVPAVTHREHDDGGRVERHIRQLLDEPTPREIRVELHEIEGQILPLPHLSPEMAEIHRAMMQDELRAVEMNLSIALSDGRWLNVGTRFERPPLQWPVLSVLTFGMTAAVILIAVFWYLMARLTGPLSRLARSAEMFGRGEDVDPLPETGPREVRELTRAFNRMRARLTRLVADRTRILAAVSHDLRSPLTALRVRAEMVDDDETREALVESVEEMQQMAEATLDFAKGLSGREAPGEVDLGALLAGIAAEAGGNLDLAPGPDVAVRVRPVAIRRALRNLVSNALRYGGQARLSWRLSGSDVEIEIRDQGPGIPEQELERVFDPFYRLESSRSLETGGHGLGLSIARSILRAHGGDIVLANHPQGGLVARVTMPRAEEMHETQATEGEQE
ncbi:MAG: two-component sensor histidine kinase [Paracoccaceae bacterium]|nr:MAG: two-component sensor histidine kinase [Paracoccaceae bacterium]